MLNTYPEWGDRIEMHVFYDYSSGGQDYYNITYNNLDRTQIIYVDDVDASGKGYKAQFQSETFNDDNQIKGLQHNADFMDTSENWNNWSYYSLDYYNPSWPGVNQLCRAQDGADDDFKFGTKVSGSCVYP